MMTQATLFDQTASVPLVTTTGVPSPVDWPEKHDLFGVLTSATTYEDATTAVIRAAHRRKRAIVSLHAAHAIVTASCDPVLRERVNQFQMVAPDGQPVRWALNRLHRTGLRDRVYGPELMMRLCRRAAKEGVPVYLYGGGPEVIEKLRDNLLEKYPALIVAGAESPPFRPLSPEEDEAVVRRINESGAGIVFVGLGCPKQDHFAYEHRRRINAVQVCVGAAFDFHAGNKKMAPRWMQRRGLEWLFRLCQEPRRLWRRYLVTNTLFAQKFAREWLRRRIASAAAIGRRRTASAASSGVALLRFARFLGGSRLQTRLEKRRKSRVGRPILRERATSEGASGAGSPAARRRRSRVAVVVPCFNEESALPRLLEKLSDVAQSLADRYQLRFIVVDDGSTDGTRRILCDELGGRDDFTVLKHERNRGVAAAIMTGIRHANTEIVCSLDADCTYDPAQLGRMLPSLVDGVDVVTASPYHPQGRVRNVSAWRLTLSKCASLLYRRIMRQKLFTYTSCFRVYRRSAVVNLQLEYDGFVGIPELLWRVDRQGSRIVECPAELEARRFGRSKMKVSSQVVGHLRLMGQALRDRFRRSANGRLQAA
jgi:exopolysaccharide biosynthesis WecB/TagA/CpsF family protein